VPAATIADLVLVLHFLFVLFIVGGLAVVLAGARRWPWVRNRTFRIAHLAAIGFVVAESLFGIACPLTTLEDALRGGSTPVRGCVGRWVAWLLYYDAPEWVLTAIYCAFALAVVWAWRAVPPRTKSASLPGS
jgi:Protein of Unknown function (DUF2784)